MAKKPIEKTETDSQQRELVIRHLKTGWIGLLIFLSLGVLLEVLHGLKLPVYLDVRNSTRRLMWTLAHAHGTLFSLIHLAFACSLTVLGNKNGKSLPAAKLRTTSRCLTGAIVFLPLGFLLGGIWIFDGDPGPGIFLVPIGAILLLIGVVRMILLIR
ncbi:MAG: hypothetical protein IH892_21715 [Planctomycetes bacterium]|nr:hypothetical protein [Planctomycetota bacterium]MCH8219381.1 hypothetical protein [Planctomycetota bacterium]